MSKYVMISMIAIALSSAPSIASAAEKPSVMQSAQADASPPASPCDTPEYRQLDFRIGTFDVTGLQGAKAGESRVESVLGGCLLVEHWHGAISGYGRANMFYDRQQKRWHLDYITDEGGTLYLTGRFEGDSLVLTGNNDFEGFAGLHRMTFSPLPNGASRQFWELSKDGGTTWKIIHDGRFARRVQ